ncbi:MAG: cytochrome c [Bacteroidetes bacterium]|jgi:mono/diheme cytochrome c family protein|nr:MAG: cytochrome c [Bacteroidota bacterium]
MKKVLTFASLLATAVIFYNCHGSKKATAAAPKTTYDGSLKAVIAANCSPCHIAGQGNKKPYDNYTNAKADIDDMIRRIDMNPTDRGFMPFKHPKLPDATIAVFKKWKADGTPEN